MNEFILTISTNNTGKVFVTTPDNERTIEVFVAADATEAESRAYVLDAVENALRGLWG